MGPAVEGRERILPTRTTPAVPVPVPVPVPVDGAVSAAPAVSAVRFGGDLRGVFEEVYALANLRRRGGGVAVVGQHRDDDDEDDERHPHARRHAKRRDDARRRQPESSKPFISNFAPAPAQVTT